MADMWQKCPNCMGTGKISEGTACPSCQGKGIINVLTGLPPKEQVAVGQSVPSVPYFPNDSGTPPFSPYGGFEVWAGEPVKTETTSFEGEVWCRKKRKEKNHE